MTIANFFSHDKESHLVWLHTAFIGDIILASAAIELVHRLAPHVRQYLITTAAGAQLLGGSPALSGCVVFDKRGGQRVAAFRAVKQQLASFALPRDRTVLLQPHTSVRSTCLAMYLGFPRITFAESTASFLATRRVARVALLHEAQRIALLLEPLGVPRELIMQARPHLPVSPNAHEQHLHPLRAHGKKIIAIAPGSVWATKRWPTSSYARVIDELARSDQSLSFVLLGSPSEAPLVADMFDALTTPAREERIINLAGKTSLPTLAALFQFFSLLVSGDSSPVHFASAHNVPTVSIFGATVPAMGFAPLAERSIVVEHPTGLDCRPCSPHGPARCPLSHFKCMREISAEQVVRACQQLLA